MSDPAGYADLEARNVIVTGASSGIGRATAILLSRMKVHVALWGRSEKKLETTLGLLSGEGHLVVPVDLGGCDSVGSVVEGIGEEMGPLHGLVHSAGLSLPTMLRTYEQEDAFRIMDVNFFSFMKICKALCRRSIVSSDGASIVALASAVSERGFAGWSCYAASKGAILAACKSLALEYASRRIRFNCISPSWVDTPMAEGFRSDYMDEATFRRNIIDRHPLGLGDPGDVAAAAAYLLSDVSRWITGTSLVVDGGYTAG